MYQLAGTWSRRITQEHRLVYKVSSNRVDFLQSRYLRLLTADPVLNLLNSRRCWNCNCERYRDPR